LVSGFWHGANWTFIVWGLLNALYIIPSIIFNTNRLHLDIVAKGKYFPSLKELLSMCLTFGLTVFAWIFFRAYNIKDAFYIIGRIFTGNSFSYQAAHIMPLTEIAFGFLIMVFLLLAERYLPAAKDYSTGKKLALTVSLILACYFLGIFDEAQFIYFQF